MPTADTIGALVAEAGARFPERDAILAPDRSPLTYRGLCDVVAGIGSTLRAAGISPGDRVALVTANGPEAVTAFLGIASVAAAAPLNPAYRRDEIAFDLSDLRARAVIVDDALETPAVAVAEELGIPVLMMTRIESEPAGAVRLTRAARPAAPDGAGPVHAEAAPGDGDDPAIALVLHTSGTTARPKIVPLRHDRLVASARSIAATLELTEADRCLNVMPLFHIHGLVAAVLASIAAGGSMVATPGFVAPSFFRWLDTFAPTWYTAVPTIHQAVLGRAADQADVIARRPLRFIRSSSASLPVAVLEGLERVFGAPVIEAYGMTEASHQMASNPLPPGVRKPGSVGRATGIEIAILDPDGRHLATGEVGEVAIRGATVFDGYEANPEANASAFSDGWFRTGDEGTLDPDGYLILRGRRKELINRGGEKVAPVEIEEALLAIGGVAQAVAFAMPDPRLGEEVAAAVVPADGARLTEHELQARLAEHLADFKVPRVIEIVPEIPKGPTGKVQRIGMADRLGLGPKEHPGATGAVEAGRGFVAPRTALEVSLAGIWSEVLGLERIGVTDDYFEAGGDSVLAAMIVTRIGERLGHRDLPLATFLWAPTIERYARSLETGSWGSATSPLIAIQPEGSRPPFFFMSIDDRIMSLAHLRRSFDPDQPLYGLRAMGLEDGDLPPSMDAVADRFLAEVRTIQPEGPYYLGGYCTGARVAMEVARRLADDGKGGDDAVAFLVLVDPRIDPPHDVRWWLGRPAFFLRRARLHFAAGHFWRSLRDFGVTSARRAAARVRGTSLEGEYVDTLAESRRATRLQAHRGDLVIFRSRDFEVPRELWEGLATQVAWEPLPVDHETMFDGDQGTIFATRLTARLRAVEGEA